MDDDVDEFRRLTGVDEVKGTKVLRDVEVDVSMLVVDCIECEFVSEYEWLTDDEFD